MSGWVGLIAAGVGILLGAAALAAQPGADSRFVTVGIVAGIGFVVWGGAAFLRGLRTSGAPKRRSKALASLISRGQVLAKEADPMGENEPPSVAVQARMHSWDQDIQSFLQDWPVQLVTYRTGLFSIEECPLTGRNDTLNWISERQVRLDRLAASSNVPGAGVGAWG